MSKHLLFTRHPKPFRTAKRLEGGNNCRCCCSRAKLVTQVSRIALIRIAALYIICLVVLSLYPKSRRVVLPTPSRMLLSHTRASRTKRVLRHRFFHVISFAGIALLLVLMARAPGQKIFAALAVIALGCAIEYAQHLIFRSRIEWWDMRDDALGAMMGYAIGQWRVLSRVLTAKRKAFG
jgi:hypothetical protein